MNPDAILLLVLIVAAVVYFSSSSSLSNTAENPTKSRSVGEWSSYLIKNETTKSISGTVVQPSWKCSHEDFIIPPHGEKFQHNNGCEATEIIIKRVNGQPIDPWIKAPIHNQFKWITGQHLIRITNDGIIVTQQHVS